PQVRDTVARLCAESSDRIPKWLLPGIRHNLEHDGEIDRAVLVVAAWARYAEGVDEQGEPITIVDRLADTLKATAQTQRDDPLAFVRNRELFGDLVDDERFASTYQRFLASLHEKGARATLEDLAGQEPTTQRGGPALRGDPAGGRCRLRRRTHEGRSHRRRPRDRRVDPRPD